MCVALVLSRAVQNLSPERRRPLHSGDPNFVAPLGSDTTVLENWSSFPSDHAVVAFALSTAIWRGSRPLGAACFAWSTFVVSLPRVYAGWHYASDILAGALLGLSITQLVTRLLPFRTKAMTWVELAHEHYPALFYAFFFVLSFELATMFDDVRRAVYYLFKTF